MAGWASLMNLGGISVGQGEVYTYETTSKRSVEEVNLNSDNRTVWETWGGWNCTDLNCDLILLISSVKKSKTFSQSSEAKGGKAY